MRMKFGKDKERSKSPSKERRNRKDPDVSYDTDQDSATGNDSERTKQPISYYVAPSRLKPEDWKTETRPRAKSPHRPTPPASPSHRPSPATSKRHSPVPPDDRNHSAKEEFRGAKRIIQAQETSIPLESTVETNGDKSPLIDDNWNENKKQYNKSRNQDDEEGEEEPEPDPEAEAILASYRRMFVVFFICLTVTLAAFVPLIIIESQIDHLEGHLEAELDKQAKEFAEKLEEQEKKEKLAKINSKDIDVNFAKASAVEGAAEADAAAAANPAFLLRMNLPSLRENKVARFRASRMADDVEKIEKKEEKKSEEKKAEQVKRENAERINEKQMFENKAKKVKEQAVKEQAMDVEDGAAVKKWKKRTYRRRK